MILKETTNGDFTPMDWKLYTTMEHTNRKAHKMFA